MQYQCKQARPHRPPRLILLTLCTERTTEPTAVILAPNTDQTVIAHREQQLLQANTRLTELTGQIAHYRDLPRSRLWQSETVIIRESSDGDDPIDGFRGTASIYSKQTLIVTKFAQQLSWCFEQLQHILRPVIDYIRLHDAFGFIADAAIEFLSRRSAGELEFEPAARAKALLLFVVQSSRRLVALSNDNALN